MASLVVSVAGTIHGGVHNDYYQVPAGASPDEKFDFALRYLASGQATTARRLLGDVVALVRDSNEVWFYWMLAFFSGRTLWELSAGERQHWNAALREIDDLPCDWWSPGVHAIRRLVAASRARSEDGSAAPESLRDIDGLDDALKNEILRHLERVVQGSLKDDLWHGDAEQTSAERMAERRTERVWMFFEPDPAEPRTRRVRPADVSGGHVGIALLTSAVVAGCVATIGWLVVQRDDTAALIALMVAAVAAGVAVVNGAEWRFRAEQLRTEQQQRRTAQFPSEAARPGGFVYKVDRMYLRYSDKYAPDGPDRVAWFVDAYAPMSRLRDEVVEVYREQGVRVDEIKWLIRHQVRELRRQWDEGALTGGARCWGVPGAVKALTAVGTVVTVLSAGWAIQAAAQQDLVRTVGVVLAMAASAWTAVLVGVRILAENKRVTAEELDRQRRMTGYWFEFQRWELRLSDRPSDMEMGRWLECDRRILLREAMQAYQLKWSDVSAYASLEAPGEGSRKARAKNGPWRYSRYKLLVFLLTADGVRQITVDLNFTRSTFHHWVRTNYRYDAVAAVRVSLRDDGAREFLLFLVDGTAIPVAVTEPGVAGPDEDPDILAAGAKDAAGLPHALFVLEGVAAEGRRWWVGPAYRRAS
jgi:hypothetical protein